MNADCHLIAIWTAVIAGEQIQKHPRSRDGAQDEKRAKDNREPNKVFHH
jgi:hypothetical protein